MIESAESAAGGYLHPMPPAPGDLLDTLLSVRKGMRRFAVQNGCALRLFYDSEIETDLEFNPILLRGCVETLVEMSVSRLGEANTDVNNGEIVIQVRSRPVGGGREHVTIEVHDNGPDLSKSDFRALASARLLARRIGAQISGKSEGGRGSVATLEMIARNLRHEQAPGVQAAEAALADLAAILAKVA